MWQYSLIDMAYAAAVIAVLWAVAAMLAAGRTFAWYGMMIAGFVALVPPVLKIWRLNFHVDSFWYLTPLDRAAVCMPAVFGICFAIHAWRLDEAARRARELEEECAALAARLEQGPSVAGRSSIPIDSP